MTTPVESGAGPTRKICITPKDLKPASARGGSQGFVCSFITPLTCRSQDIGAGSTVPVGKGCAVGGGWLAWVEASPAGRAYNVRRANVGTSILDWSRVNCT